MTPSEQEALLSGIEGAAELVYRVMPPTPQYHWPLLSQRAGCEVWVKHENHTPTGAFKLRGALVYMEKLRQAEPPVSGVVAASRGNHGQSLALAGRLAGIPVTVVVPQGNNAERNAAIIVQGAELVEFGDDYQEAREHAHQLAGERGLHLVSGFHPWLVQGSASFALEFFRGAPPLDRIYVPIGMGTGICAVTAARDALGLSTRIIGVVAEGAPAYADSYWAGRPMTTPTANTIAEGLACRVPDPTAVNIISEGVEKVVTVSDDEILAAMRHYFTDTHNLAEGAGAAALAALLADPDAQGRVGVVLSGGNPDRSLFARALEEMDGVWA